MGLEKWQSVSTRTRTQTVLGHTFIKPAVWRQQRRLEKAETFPAGKHQCLEDSTRNLEVTNQRRFRDESIAVTGYGMAARRHSKGKASPRTETSPSALPSIPC